MGGDSPAGNRAGTSQRPTFLGNAGPLPAILSNISPRDLEAFPVHPRSGRRTSAGAVTTRPRGDTGVSTGLVSPPT